MIRRLSKHAFLALLLGGVSCQSFTWTGRGGQVDPEAAARGVKDVKALEREYETQRYWAFWRRNLQGKWDSFWSGLHEIHRSVDRHVFNYDWDDPKTRY